MRYILIVSVLAAVLGLFQNCADPLHSGRSLSSFHNDFFNYNYKTTPVFYADIQLYRETTAPEDLSEFVFVGALSYPQNRTATVSYQVRITSLDKQTVICPTQTGTLLNGSTMIMFSCLSPVGGQPVHIELTAASGAVQEVFTKNY